MVWLSGAFRSNCFNSWLVLTTNWQITSRFCCLFTNMQMFTFKYIVIYLIFTNARKLDFQENQFQNTPDMYAVTSYE